MKGASSLSYWTNLSFGIVWQTRPSVLFYTSIFPSMYLPMGLMLVELSICRYPLLLPNAQGKMLLMTLIRLLNDICFSPKLYLNGSASLLTMASLNNDASQGGLLLVVFIDSRNNAITIETMQTMYSTNTIPATKAILICTFRLSCTSLTFSGAHG